MTSSFSTNTISAMSYSIILIIYILFFTGCSCLKLAKLVVPQYKMRGDNALLECNYELEGDTLYSVKWYKENEEFYRFVPKSNPTQASYKVEGVKVDHHHSDNHHVSLKNVNLKSTGVYRCEVSAEAPSFSSAHKEARMEVLYIPNSGPFISGKEKEYFIGDEISLNCTSSRSYPASVLHWFINELQVTNPANLVVYPNYVHPLGLMTSSLGLRLTVLPQHFIQGTMRLKCVASLSPVLWQGDRESIVQSEELSDREALLLVKGGASSLQRKLTNCILILTTISFLIIVST